MNERPLDKNGFPISAGDLVRIVVKDDLPNPGAFFGLVTNTNARDCFGDMTKWPLYALIGGDEQCFAYDEVEVMK